jgi:hypothetical protein
MNFENISLVQLSLLKACLADNLIEREIAVRNWESNVNIEELDFSSLRLISYFFHLNQNDRIFTKYDKRIKVIYKHWWLRSQHINHQLKEVQQILSDAGIKVVVIKGASIKLHYEKEELRTMADFDLLVSKNDLNLALQLVKQLDFIPNTFTELCLQKGKNLFLDFRHAIPLTNFKNNTQLDLHWKIGSKCSESFTNSLWQHLEDYGINSNLKKPTLAYEVFMIIIHAVDTENRDNLNWIIDIAVINKKYGHSFWKEARQIAVSENKLDLFDYGCSLLLKLGLYAPNPGKVSIPKTTAFFLENRDGANPLQLMKSRFFHKLITVQRLFPNTNIFWKSYQLFRNLSLTILIRMLMKRAS